MHWMNICFPTQGFFERSFAEADRWNSWADWEKMNHAQANNISIYPHNQSQSLLSPWTPGNMYVKSEKRRLLSACTYAVSHSLFARACCKMDFIDATRFISGSMCPHGVWFMNYSAVGVNLMVCYIRNVLESFLFDILNKINIKLTYRFINLAAGENW